MTGFDRWWPTLAVALAFSIATPAAAADANTRVHWRLVEPGQSQAPRKVLILDSQIEVHELSAGGVTQKVPQLTRDAGAHFDSALRRVLASRTDNAAVPMPALSETEQDELDDTIATFNVVAGEAFGYTQPGLAGWEDRAARLDYTLGFGLPWLQARTGDILWLHFWVAGDDLDRSIRRARNLYRDEALAAYLQSVLDALYPEFRGAVHGYSRDSEREADRVGFERVVRAGYPPQAGVEAFEILARSGRADESSPLGRPVLDHERRHPGEFAHVVRDEHRLQGQGMRSDPGVVGADRQTLALESRPHLAVVQAGSRVHRGYLERSGQLGDARLVACDVRALPGTEGQFSQHHR